MIFKISLLFITIYFITACSSNNQINIDTNKEFNITNLDKADDNYIELKGSDDIDSDTLKNEAKKLALAHMKNSEFILANFYIQEALGYEPSNKELKFLLVKNQYLAAKMNKNNQAYLERAYKAIKDNSNLISDYEYAQEANNLVQEVKNMLELSYLNTSNYYKKIGKIEASNKYLEKIEEFNRIN